MLQAAPAPPPLAAPPRYEELLDARGRTIVVRFFAAGSAPAAFSIDAAPVRLHLTPQNAGAQTIELHAVQRGIVASAVQSDPKAPRYREQQAELDFQLPATASAAMYSVGIDMPQPHARPVPDLAFVPGSLQDADLMETRKRYLGRAVYVLGGLGLHCAHVDRAGVTIDIGVRSLSVLHVSGVQRGSGAGAIFSLGSAARYRETPALYLALEPLTFTFDASVAKNDIDGILTSAEGPVSANEIHARSMDVAEHPHACGAFTASFSGGWDAERTLSTRNAGGGWPQPLVAAIRKGAVQNGWSRDMVAAALGYPSVYGTPAQMNLLNVWPYAEPAPFYHAVTFAGGRVVKYEPPGELP